jgi:hypothetical protein
MLTDACCAYQSGIDNECGAGKPIHLPVHTAEVGIESVYFGAFYGGGDASWGPSKDTYSYFKNIRVYNGDSP